MHIEVLSLGTPNRFIMVEVTGTVYMYTIRLCRYVIGQCITIGLSNLYTWNNCSKQDDSKINITLKSTA